MFVATESECAARSVEDGLAEVCGQVNAGTGRLVSLIGEALRTGAWVGAGIRSPKHYVMWQCGVSAGRARQLVAIACRLPDFPICRAAFEAGELTGDQMAVICRHAPAHLDGRMAELARMTTVPQLTRALRPYPFVEPDPNPGDEPEPVPEPDRREVRFGFDGDGSWSMSGSLPADEGAGLEEALRAARDDLFHAGATNVSWADALVRLADAYLGRADGTAQPGRYRVNIHVPVDVDQPGHFHRGPVVPDHLRRLIGCDTTITFVYERHGTPVNVGRATRVIPDRLRLVVEDRDRGCRFPGCTQARWLHLHHIRHWEDDGPTDTENLICLCPHHHREHHRGRLGIDGNADTPDGIRFTGPGGGRIPTRPPPVPPTRPPPVTGTWHHPLGERLHTKWVFFPPPPSPN